MAQDINCVMKLINHLLIRLSLVLILVLLLWSLIYFLLQMKEIHDGNDEGLLNLKQEFILKANRDSNFVITLQKYNPLNVIIEEIPFEEAEHFKEFFSTERLYFETELEEEEVRMLITAFYCEPNGRHYKLKCFTSTVEQNDLIKNMLYLLIMLWVILSVVFIIVGKRIIHRTNKPFYDLLHKLQAFRLDSAKIFDFSETAIQEYQQLNNTVRHLLEQNIGAFVEQKNFIENASHELQTPVAIAIMKLETLMNEGSLTETQMQELSTVISVLERMKKLNNNLLLISKIKNNQYSDMESVDLKSLMEDVLAIYEELLQYKEIEVKVETFEIPVCRMNADLAHIMLSNLVKNAIAHNRQGGDIAIAFRAGSLTIANSGAPLPPNKNIFDRYVANAQSSKSSGLGLSIVKTIADLYHIEIGYYYKTGWHVFEVKIEK